MTLFGTQSPTVQELLDIRHFYPEECDFYWGGSGKLPEISLMMFRDYDNIQDVCKGCTRQDCPVRQVPNPNLEEQPTSPNN